MKVHLLLTLFLSSSLSIESAQASQTNLLEEIYENLDITTFRNSLFQMRETGQKTLPSLKLRTSYLDDKKFEIENDDWLYRVELTETRDGNDDGILDYIICFTDESKIGTYYARKSLLLTRYTRDGDFIALNYSVDACR
jgi:hypothetical protein